MLKFGVSSDIPIFLFNPVIRSHYGKGFLKQYVRDLLCLRTELATNDVTDYGIKKAVENLPPLRDKLATICDNYLTARQDILETFVDRGKLRKFDRTHVLASWRPARPPGSPKRARTREKPKTALTAARGFCKLRKSWSKVRFRSETKPGRRRSAPGPENQIPILRCRAALLLTQHADDLRLAEPALPLGEARPRAQGIMGTTRAPPSRGSGGRTGPMSEDVPVRATRVILKQVNPADLSVFGLKFLDDHFSGFLTPVTIDTPGVAEEISFLKALAGNNPVYYDTRYTRRYAGETTFELGRYHTICLSPAGDDGGTLIKELRSYYNTFKSGLVDVFDTTVSHSRAVIPRFVTNELARHAGTHQSGHLVLLVRPLGGKPFPFSAPPFAVALPLRVQELTIERVLDLRVPEVACWFTRKLSTLVWMDNDQEITAFPLKPALQSFRELLPSLLSQAFGGAPGATQVAGIWLRGLGVEALVFPSARADAMVRARNGELEGSSGWNLVDYRASGKPRGPMVDVSPGWPSSIGAWGGDLNRPIVFASATINSVDDGEASGSWWIDGLEKTRSALIHMAEMELCLSTCLDLEQDKRISDLFKLMWIHNNPDSNTNIDPWITADVWTTDGIEWLELFCSGVKDIFFGRSLVGNLGSKAFGDDRSRNALEAWIASNSGGHLAAEINNLTDILREISNRYRRPFSPKAFLYGGLSSERE
jgi:hypothetical protein